MLRRPASVLLNGRGACGEIDIGPGELAGFPSTQSPVGDELPERGYFVRGGEVQEGASLLRGPHGDRMALAAALPLGHSLRRPHHRPRRPAGLQLDELRRVAGEHAPLHCGVESSGQGGVHASDPGGREHPGGLGSLAAGLEEPPQEGGRAMAGWEASLDLAHRGVELGDVRGAQVAQAQVAEAGREVQLDVIPVALSGARSDFGSTVEPLVPGSGAR